MNLKRIAIISLFILLAGAAISIVLSIKDTLVNKSEEIVVEDNSYTNIQINSDNASVHVLPTKKNETKVEFSGKMKKKFNYNFRANVIGDTLQVELKEKHWGFIQFGVISHEVRLTVYVPEKEYSQLKTEIDNGRIIVDNLKVNDVDLETDNGSIELKNIEAKFIQATSNNGQILMDNVDGDLKVETDNGRIDLKTNNLERSIEFKTDNGLINIQTDKEPLNATINAKIDLGMIDIFGKSTKQTVFGNGENLINLEADNGKISVKKSK